MFKPSLDTLLSELTDLADDRQAYKQYAGEQAAKHAAKVAEHQAHVARHTADGERAARIAERVVNLLQ